VDGYSIVFQLTVGKLVFGMEAERREAGSTAVGGLRSASKSTNTANNEPAAMKNLFEHGQFLGWFQPEKCY
jgi:hypothetical protein